MLRMIRQFGLWVVRVALAVVAALTLFALTPLIGSKPISALPMEDRVDVPPSARSFHVDHGRIAFSDLGVPAEDPWRFTFLVLVSVGAIAGLIASWRDKKADTD